MTSSVAQLPTSEIILDGANLASYLRTACATTRTAWAPSSPRARCS